MILKTVGKSEESKSDIFKILFNKLEATGSDFHCLGLMDNYDLWEVEDENKDTFIKCFENIYTISLANEEEISALKKRNDEMDYYEKNPQVVDYTYYFSGDFWSKDGKHNNYSFEFPIPIKYATIKEAKGCNASARFEKRDGHAVVVIYSDWEQGMNNGKWHESVKGNEIGVIRQEEYWMYTMAIQKEESANKGCIDQTDFLPSCDSWDEIFCIDEKANDWYYIIESLAFNIVGNVRC